MKTPLYEEHVALGARMVDFSGWTMPLLYLPAGGQGRGIIQEHVHTRECASIFDTCHMGIFEISGTAAESDLEYLVTQSVSSLKPGACSYGYLLAENGGVIDDL
ncbi:MAG: glycine cleavage system protein T, partial [Planctomycetes bacterium]|nr:glycine cleavage system protein T [Planctomycetota bacterium]